jgi:uncharacterized protein (DUF58 family)
MESNVFDKEFFEKINTLKLSLSMKLTAGMSGARKSTAKGSSVEFSDFREYMPGDDIRRIDWNVYGRTDKLYIKQFMEEKEGIFNIFIDTSKSMDFGQKNKFDCARQVAGALSYIILNNLDRVYINDIKENSLNTGKGLTGAAAFPRILNELERMNCTGKTSLSHTIRMRKLTSGGASIIISDFLDREGIEDAMKYLAFKKQKIILVQIMAFEEENISYEGTVNILDSETDDRVKITMSNAVIKKYGESLSGLKMNLKKIARKYGADYVYVRSDDSLTNIMLHGFSRIISGK